jgi:NTP pyrophosphatase (non-canonical NTP hydrolase)
MKFEGLKRNVIQWADKKDLVLLGNSFSQYAKFQEEGNEILVAMNKIETLFKESDVFLNEVWNDELKNNMQEWMNKKESAYNELKDGLGDTIVTLIILAAQYDLDIVECLEYAYNEIKDRTGKTVDGTFIKD